MSVLCHLALRAVTQRGLPFFRGLQEHLALAPGTQPKKQGALSQEQKKYLKVSAYGWKAFAKFQEWTV